MFSYELFGERLMRARTLQGLTTREIGDAVGVNHSSITGAEKGRHALSLETLYRVSEALDVSVDYLIGRTDDPVLHQLGR